jgi:long-subunit fatty acid transport protein
MTQNTNLRSRGSAGEFTFALGMNINNILYLGLSVDVVTITRKQTIYYSEYVDYEGTRPDATSYPYQLQQFQLGQSMHIDGAGVGAKLGLVVRPTEGLRIGFAVHTPSYYSLAYRYEGWLSSDALSVGSNPNDWDVVNGHVYANERTPILQDGGDHRWKISTPTRLLAGVSYAFGSYALITVDYEYDTYSTLSLDYAPTNPGYKTEDFENSLLGVHYLRGGIEVKPAPWLSLRAGGGLNSNIMADNYDSIRFSEPINDYSWYASAGLGFRLGKVTSVDLAYQYINSRYTNYYSFYTQLGDVPNCSPLYGLDIIKHNVALTLAFRF